MASPLKIMIGLHYWTTPAPYAEHDPMHANSPAVQEAVQEFINGGLLVERAIPSEYGSKYEGTDALRAWVEALCDVRWPVQIWVVPPSLPRHESGEAASPLDAIHQPKP